MTDANLVPPRFLRIVLKGEKVSQAEFAKLIGWSDARVSYLCSSPDCSGFPFNELGKMRHALRMPERRFMDYLNRYFLQLRDIEQKG